MKKFSKVLGLIGLGVIGATAVASADPLTVAVDTTHYLSIAGGVLVAMGVFFGIRKALQLIR